MKNKKLMIIAAVLVLVAVIAAAVHFMTAPKAAEGDVILTYGGKTTGITLADLELTDVNGVRVNGKGEEIEVNGKGISVKDLLTFATLGFAESSTERNQDNADICTKSLQVFLR